MASLLLARYAFLVFYEQSSYLSLMATTLCPCGSGTPYQACCQPYLSGTAIPSSPEQLMRSRYTAFRYANLEYLMATHHPSQRQADDRQTLAKTIAETHWFSLQVLNSDRSQEANGVGTVEFVAFYQSQGEFGQLHERSQFIRQDNRWFYHHGTILPPITIGRNDPCWCGSGKKYKKCHGG